LNTVFIGQQSKDPKSTKRRGVVDIVEDVVDNRIDVEKALCGRRRLEPLHFALSSPRNLIGVFGAVILSESPLMRTGEAQVSESGAV